MAARLLRAFAKCGNVAVPLAARDNLKIYRRIYPCMDWPCRNSKRRLYKLQNHWVGFRVEFRVTRLSTRFHGCNRYVVTLLT